MEGEDWVKLVGGDWMNVVGEEEEEDGEARLKRLGKGKCDEGVDGSRVVVVLILGRLNGNEEVVVEDVAAGTVAGAGGSGAGV